jgi:hypothetical protein
VNLRVKLRLKRVSQKYILTIILSLKIVLTLRVKLPCPKCKILIVREILVLSFIVSEKNKKWLEDTNGYSESVNRRRRDNTMTKRKRKTG